MAASPKEKRKARSFLRARGAKLNPHKFAGAAKELDASFWETLQFIGRMRAGGQNESFYRRELLRDIARSGG